jgi:hypothetical protein
MICHDYSIELEKLQEGTQGKLLEKQNLAYWANGKIYDVKGVGLGTSVVWIKTSVEGG